MRIEINQHQAAYLYCLVRQAERSIAHAVEPACPWSELREFYGPERLSRVQAGVEWLAMLTTLPATRICGDQVFPSKLSLLFSCLLRRWTNPIRASWQFRVAEIQFFLQTMQSLRSSIEHADRPSVTQLVELRMDLCCCETVMENQLNGLPMLAKAAKIENFGQLPFFAHYTLDEIVPDEVLAAIKDEVHS